MTVVSKQNIFIIAGPTAGGKSARALELAKAKNGVIINADSRQIYDGLPILSAQPSPTDKDAAPHRLYGAIRPNDSTSAGNWREMAEPIIRETLENGQTPIIVGGTGLYINALVKGLSPIPDIPGEIRAAAGAKQRELGNPAFHAQLMKRDPATASRLDPANTARLVRAWEVLEFTGRPLSELQKLPRLGPPPNWNFIIEKIMPDREELNARCDARFLMMMEAGAPEEAEEFQRRIKSGEVREDALLTNSLGFKSLISFIKGLTSKDQAVAEAQAETRKYAKRQVTWFRHQL